MISDYTQANFLFKARKAARYVRLYGLSRTLSKIKGQYHMNSTEAFDGLRWENLACRTPDAQDRNVAIIGCGNYAFSNIAYYLRRRNPRCLRATYDRNKSKALSLCKAYGGAYAVAEWKDILADPQVRMLFIASNHGSHASYATEAIRRGLNVYIEKPISVTVEDLVDILQALRHSSARVFAGYNRPFSPAIRLLRQEMTIDPAGGFFIQCFVSGHKIPAEHWYRKPEEGTRVCGNLGHWLDLAVHLFMWRSLPDILTISLLVADDKEPDDNLVVAFNSDQGDIFSVMLTSTCEPFEGIHETISIQHANTICKIDDFRRVTIWQNERLITKRFWPKNVGHGLAILQSFHNDVIRDWQEVVMSTLLMLHIADMVRNKCRSSVFSFTRSWEAVSNKVVSA